MCLTYKKDNLSTKLMVGNISALSILFSSMDSKFAKPVMTGIYISILKEIKLRK